jgi:thioredoxin reductase (NADPH)
MSDGLDLFVIGAGAAGLAAANEAARRGLSVCIAEESMFGGLVINVNHLRPGAEGWPAAGCDLAASLMEGLAEQGVEMLFEGVIALDRGLDGQCRIETTSGPHSARSVIVASGARMRKLDVPGVDEFEHRGVSHCGDCDGPMFRSAEVMVVGGGDSALQEALILAEFCSTVHLVHRGERFSARTHFVDAATAEPSIAVHLRTVVESLVGAEAVTGARLRDLASGQTRTQSCQGFFPFVGLEANTAFLPPSVKMTGDKIDVNEQLESSLENVFAIGAVRVGYGGEVSHAFVDAKTAVDVVAERLRRPGG